MRNKPVPTKNDIITIARRCIDAYDAKLVTRLDTQDTTLENHTTVLQEQSLQLKGIEGQIREIYGNGSGRKGILDNMKEVQATQAGILASLSVTVGQEKEAQGLFRLEVRNALKIRDTEQLTRITANNRWIKAIKWLATPIGVAAWELIKSHYKIGEK